MYRRHENEKLSSLNRVRLESLLLCKYHGTRDIICCWGLSEWRHCDVKNLYRTLLQANPCFNKSVKMLILYAEIYNSWSQLKIYFHEIQSQRFLEDFSLARRFEIWASI